MMNTPKCEAEDYIQFLIASPRQFSCTEAALVQPGGAEGPAHDSFRRLLLRQQSQPEALWQEAQGQVQRDDGVLILDDSTLDKPYSRAIDLVCWHWSGKHHGVVKGINLLTLLWTDGDRHVPCDFRLYDNPQDGLTKNDHFRQMLQVAAQRGFKPRCVGFDSWYASVANLKQIRQLGWTFLTRLKANRQVRVDFAGPQAIATVPIPPGGREVYLPGYGLLKVFRVVAQNGDTEHWASNDLAMDELTRLKYADFSWRIEE